MEWLLIFQIEHYLKDRNDNLIWALCTWAFCTIDLSKGICFFTVVTEGNAELIDVLRLKAKQKCSDSELSLFVDWISRHLLCSVIEQIRQISDLLLLLLVKHHFRAKDCHHFWLRQDGIGINSFTNKWSEQFFVYRSLTDHQCLLEVGLECENICILPIFNANCIYSSVFYLHSLLLQSHRSNSDYCVLLYHWESLDVDSHLEKASLPVLEPHHAEDVIKFLFFNDLSKDVEVSPRLDLLWLFVSGLANHWLRWLWHLQRYVYFMVVDQVSFEVVLWPCSQLVNDLTLTIVETELRVRACNWLVPIFIFFFVLSLQLC